MRFLGILVGAFLIAYVSNVLRLSGDTASAQGSNVHYRIMPLGDSITYDNHSGDTRPAGLRTGYRQPLYLSLVEAGYDVDFVGSMVAGQDAVPQFDPDNEGHPGWRDDEIAAEIYAWLSNSPAEIILLHIGTNALDTNSSDVEKILDEIDRYESDSSSEIRVFLARIINRMGHTCPNGSRTTTFNNNVEVMALDRVTNPVNDAYPDKITIVDLECGAGIDYDQDMYDSLHPNHVGYKKMADAWKTSLDRVIKQPPHPPTGLRIE